MCYCKNNIRTLEGEIKANFHNLSTESKELIAKKSKTEQNLKEQQICRSDAKEAKFKADSEETILWQRTVWNK